MMKKHMNIFFPQWQGGGKNKLTYKGALEIKKNYLSKKSFIDVEVTLEDNDPIENDIIGYQAIVKQLEQCKNLIIEEKPITIFTVGGGCDIVIAPISYLNSKTNGDLTVLWFDAHGDLNTPETSISKAFHGMPLRVLLGEGDKKILDHAFSRLWPSQIVLLGTRDLDDAETQYIDEKNILSVKVDEIETNANGVLDAIKAKGSGNIYIHIDLDVIDPGEFSYVPVPVMDGLKIQTLSSLLKRLDKEFTVLGLSVTEYQKSGEQTIHILQEIIDMGIVI